MDRLNADRLTAVLPDKTTGFLTDRPTAFLTDRPTILYALSEPRGLHHSPIPPPCCVTDTRTADALHL